MTKKRHWMPALIILLGLGMGFEAPLAAQGDPGTVIFDHLGTNASRTYSLELAAGDQITVNIKNTDPTQFDYRIAGIEISEPPPPPGPAALGDTALETKTLKERYDPTYGAYIVEIARKAGASGQITVGGQPKQLNSVTLVIKVEQLTWNLEFAGAFTGTNLADPVFSLETEMSDGEERQIVISEPDKENEATLGLGAFIHVFHQKLPSLAGTFGLGIQSDSDTSYYLGLTWRMNSKAALTAGAVWSSVDRLPAGLRLGDEVSDANALSNLGSRIEQGWFLGISYTFLNVRDFFQKPFKTPEAGGNGG